MVSKCDNLGGLPLKKSKGGLSSGKNSEYGGKNIYQISFEHKPQNELTRIRKAGCKIYTPMFGNVWRLFPGAIAVIITL